MQGSVCSLVSRVWWVYIQPDFNISSCTEFIPNDRMMWNKNWWEAGWIFACRPSINCISKCLAFFMFAHRRQIPPDVLRNFTFKVVKSNTFIKSAMLEAAFCLCVCKSLLKVGALFDCLPLIFLERWRLRRSALYLRHLNSGGVCRCFLNDTLCVNLCQPACFQQLQIRMQEVGGRMLEVPVDLTDHLDQAMWSRKMLGLGAG